MFPLAGRSVLVIEDETLIAMLIDDLLRDTGAITLGPVYTVGDALALLQSIRPDAAVLDMNLFGRSAVPVADALASYGIPFVVATGYSLDDTLRSHPDVPLLAKPFAPGELIAALVAVISKDGARSPLPSPQPQPQAVGNPDPTPSDPRSSEPAPERNPTW